MKNKSKTYLYSSYLVSWILFFFIFVQCFFLQATEIDLDEKIPLYKEITYGKYMELDGYLPYGLYEPFDESKIKKLEEKNFKILNSKLKFQRINKYT